MTQPGNLSRIVNQNVLDLRSTYRDSFLNATPFREMEEEHPTVYVERHLPQRFRKGLTLSENDVQQIRFLLAWRDQHLKRLYRYIKKLTGELIRFVRIGLDD